MDARLGRAQNPVYICRYAIQCEKICGICQETKDQVWRVSRAGKTNIYTFVSDRYVRGWTCLPLFFVLLKDILKIRLIET